MHLNKRIGRNIRKNLSFYIVCSFLTMLTCILIIAATSTGVTMTTVFDDLFSRRNVEDAQVYTAKPIPEEEVKQLCKEYSLDIEKSMYHDEEYENFTLRLLSKNENINTYELTQGRDISNDNEILMSQRFAETQGLEIGDAITIKGNQYKIVGYMIRPDYMYMLKSQADTYFNYNSFGTAVSTKKSMENIGDFVSYYSVKFKNNNNYDFRTKLNDEYIVLSYTAATSNIRIKTVAEQGGKVKAMALNFSPVLFCIVMAVIALVLSRKIKEEQKQIGTLSALGYRKKDIIRHYLVYSSIPAFIGSILGVVLGIVLTNPFSDFYFGDFETFPHTIDLYMQSIIVTIFVPFILFSIVAIYIVNRLLKNDTVDLLNGVVGKHNKKTRRFLVNSRLNFKFKFRIRSIVSNILRTMVILFGIICASICVLFGFVLLDALDNTMDQAKSDILYENSYYLGHLSENIPNEADGVIQVTCEVENKTTLFDIWGIDQKNDFIKLKTLSGAKVEYGKYYMTEAAAEAFDIKAGDYLEFHDILTAEKHNIKIEDIVDEKTNSIVYTSRENASVLRKCKASESNLIISGKDLDLEENLVITKLSKTKMLKAAEKLVNIFIAMCYIIMVIGVVLGVMVVYLISDMLINENTSNITMLSVLGYRRKEINTMILNVNHLLVIIGFIISYPITLMISKASFKDSITTMGVYVPVSISVKSCVISFIIIVVSYLMVLFSLRKRVDKQNIIESLNDNRE